MGNEPSTSRKSSSGEPSSTQRGRRQTSARRAAARRSNRSVKTAEQKKVSYAYAWNQEADYVDELEQVFEHRTPSVGRASRRARSPQGQSGQKPQGPHPARKQTYQVGLSGAILSRDDVAKPKQDRASRLARSPRGRKPSFSKDVAKYKQHRLKKTAPSPKASHSKSPKQGQPHPARKQTYLVGLSGANITAPSPKASHSKSPKRKQRQARSPRGQPHPARKQTYLVGLSGANFTAPSPKASHSTKSPKRKQRLAKPKRHHTPPSDEYHAVEDEKEIQTMADQLGPNPTAPSWSPTSPKTASSRRKGLNPYVAEFVPEVKEAPMIVRTYHDPNIYYDSAQGGWAGGGGIFYGRPSLNVSVPRLSSTVRAAAAAPDPAPRETESRPSLAETKTEDGQWVFYWATPTKREQHSSATAYLDSIMELASFDGIDDFWVKATELKLPSHIGRNQGKHTYMIFRKGLTPIWESFPNGGSWIMNFPRTRSSSAQIDNIWESLMFNLVSEGFAAGKEIVGATCHIRKNSYRITLWNRDNSHSGNIRFHIAEQMRVKLNLNPRSTLHYKNFRKAVRDGSTTSMERGSESFQFHKVRVSIA